MSNLIPPALCNPKLFKMMDPLLRKNRARGSIKNSSELIGFLSSLATCPIEVDRNRWFPMIWSNTGRLTSPYLTKEELAEGERLSTSFYNHCCQLFYEKDLSIYFNGDHKVDVTAWCRGFNRGMNFLNPFLSALERTMDNDGAEIDRLQKLANDFYDTNGPNAKPPPVIVEAEKTLMSGLFLTIIVTIGDGSKNALDPQMEKKYFPMMARFALNFYDYLYECAKKEGRIDFDDDEMSDKVIPIRPMPAKNDACPCGSGKKYIKCCMKKN